MHHRYSEPVKKWSHSASPSPSHRWPEKGTVEYYAELADRDRFLRGRRLSQFDAGLAFSDGNSTFRISSLGLYVTISFFLFLSFSINPFFTISSFLDHFSLKMQFLSFSINPFFRRS
jgi:hypothetical protein